MIKILTRGGVTGIALVFVGAVLLVLIAVLIKWLPWLQYVFLLLFAFGFVALLNWAFKE
ncbi:MAG: hypothetical protein HOP01_07550 [Gallionella sp.]|nr:hypothetical protein [Gallionella sp.]